MRAAEEGEGRDLQQGGTRRMEGSDGRKRAFKRGKFMKRTITFARLSDRAPDAQVADGELYHLLLEFLFLIPSVEVLMLRANNDSVLLLDELGNLRR